jgi:hypothetical protein
MNLAKLLESPAVVTHRGVMFHSKGGKQLAPTAEAFGLETDAYGVIDQRALNSAVALTLTPIGVWTQSQLDVLYRWQNPQIGQLVTPRYDIDSINTADDEITLLGSIAADTAYLNFPRAGCPMQFGTFGAAPAPLVAGTLYYAGVPDPEVPNVITLHASEAAAIAGTGDHVLIEQEPLVIHTFDNRKITFHNAAVVSMPPIIHSAKASLLGQVGFAAFRKNNVAWDAENSLYTVTKEILVDVPPSEDDIPTLEYTAAWGAAPWDAFKFRGAATLTPALTTAPVTTDSRGDLGLKISALAITATGAPESATEAQLLDVLQLQGAGTGIGKSKTRADLVISGTGVHNTVYNAAATALPQTFSVSDPRAGEIAWVASRTPGQPAFRVALAAP